MTRRWWQRLLRPLPSHARRISQPLRALDAVLPETPQVSVVMTVYDTAPWLQAAMESILRQSWKALELIVVDDASNDGSDQIIRAMAARDSRIKPHRLACNGGTYRAKNHGIALATGNVLTFMDSDDVAEPERIASQLALLRDPTLVATTCNYVRVNDEGIRLLNRGLEQRQALISLMIKREVVHDIGWFDSVRFAADDEFFERLRHVYGRSAHANVSEPLYLALARKGSLSTDADHGVSLDLTTHPDALGRTRQEYRQAYRAWHEDCARRGMRPWMPCAAHVRPFPVDAVMLP